MNELEDIAENHPNVYRECAMAMLRVLHASITLATESTAAAWAVMFATNHPKCAGLSMTQVAKRIGVSRATISVIATKFCDDYGLPPSPYMKSEEAQESAKQARIKQLSNE